MNETNLLQQYFPMIRKREEILEEIYSKGNLLRKFQELGERGQEELLAAKENKDE